MKTQISKLIITLAAFSLLSFTIPTFASSGGGYGGGNSRDYRSKPVDKVYELGKAVYQGKRGNKLKYCIDNGSAKVKLKSRSAKSFKRKSANEFFVALYDCNQPETQVANILEQGDAYALVYYFNKRYRLKLTGL